MTTLATMIPTGFFPAALMTPPVYAVGKSDVDDSEISIKNGRRQAHTVI